MAEMILTFEWDGKTVHKEVKGMTGSNCIGKTEFMEKALGQAGEHQLKSEYYEQVEDHEDRLEV